MPRLSTTTYRRVERRPEAPAPPRYLPRFRLESAARTPRAEGVSSAAPPYANAFRWRGTSLLPTRFVAQDRARFEPRGDSEPSLTSHPNPSFRASENAPFPSSAGCESSRGFSRNLRRDASLDSPIRISLASIRNTIRDDLVPRIAARFEMVSHWIRNAIRDDFALDSHPKSWLDGIRADESGAPISILEHASRAPAET